MHLRHFLILPLYLCSILEGQQVSPPPSPVAKPSRSPQDADYDLRWGVKIPLRDKVELNATLYLPKNAAKGDRTPVIFTLTPYISDSYHARSPPTANTSLFADSTSSWGIYRRIFSGWSAIPRLIPTTTPWSRRRNSIPA